MLQRIHDYLKGSSLEECLSCSTFYIGVAVSICLIVTQSAFLIGLWCYAMRLKKRGICLHTEFSKMKQRMSLCEQSTLHVSNAARGQVVVAATAASPSSTQIPVQIQIRQTVTQIMTTIMSSYAQSILRCGRFLQSPHSLITSELRAKITFVIPLCFTKPDQFRPKTRDGPMGGRLSSS